MDSNVKVATKPLPRHTDTPVLEHRNIPKPQTHGPSSIGTTSSDESDIEENLVSTINYNTITSLTALKDMLHINGEDTDCGTFFQHYFLNHVNALPSRHLVSPFPFVEKRRLSECLEEDEDDEEKREIENDNENENVSNSASDKSLSESSSSTQTIQELTGTTHKFVVTKAKDSKTDADSKDLKTVIKPLVPSAFRKRNYHPSNTVHFPATDPRKPSLYSIFSRTSPLQSPHFDKRFFDSSLIEMRSQASSTSTLDQDSIEDIWIKRPEKEIKPVSLFILFFKFFNKNLV